MSGMTDAGSNVNDLNKQLHGSPYLLPADARGSAIAEILAKQGTDVEQRWRAVEANFASQLAEVSNRLTLMSDAELVYESNKIESSGLPLKETEEAIKSAPASLDRLAEEVARLTVTGDPHLVEVLGLHQAHLFGKQLASDFHRRKLPLRELDIRDLHRFAVPQERHRGSYRSIAVTIGGATHRPPDPLDVPRQMRDLVEYLNRQEANPILEAAVIHSWLAAIHPFEDGNGRVARLMANIVLLRAGWPPLIVRDADRGQYLDALAHSDEAGDLLPLYELFVKSVRRGLKRLQNPDLAVRLYEADLRRQPGARFELWATLVNRFLDQLRTSLRAHGWYVERLTIPPQSNFLLLEERDASGNLWLAKVRSAQGADFLLWLGYMSVVTEQSWPDARLAPSIFVSERDRRDEAPHPYRSPFEHTRLRIAELTLVPTVRDTQVLVRYGGSTVLPRPVEAAATDLAGALLAANAC
jgi:Fic family protein